MGTGSGIAAFLLASRGVDVVGVDARAEWEPFWAISLAESQAAGRIALRRGDAREALGGPYDVVVSNPPFFPAGSGPFSPDPWKAAARTETTATLEDFVRSGLAALSPQGRLCLVIPIERERAAIDAGLPAVPTRIVRVGARRVLVELRHGGTPATIETIDEAGARERWYGLATGG